MERRVDLVPLSPPCGFGSLSCKNDGNDSQSASQATIKINGWLAERFDILGWTAAVLQGAGEHFAVLHCHPIKQAASPHLCILPRKQTPGMSAGPWSTFLVPCSAQAKSLKSGEFGGSWGSQTPPPPAPGWIS